MASSPATRCRDFKATLYDGSFHPVDSNELSFKIAASMALKDGVHQAKPALLEPIMAVEIRVPEAYMGEVNRDLNGRRGPGARAWTPTATSRSSPPTCPQAELFTYATELRSLAQGRGTFTATLDHYDDVPSHIAEKVIGRPPQGGRGGRRPRRRPLGRSRGAVSGVPRAADERIALSGGRGQRSNRRPSELRPSALRHALRTLQSHRQVADRLPRKAGASRSFDRRTHRTAIRVPLVLEIADSSGHRDSARSPNRRPLEPGRARGPRRSAPTHSVRPSVR